MSTNEDSLGFWKVLPEVKACPRVPVVIPLGTWDKPGSGTSIMYRSAHSSQVVLWLMVQLAFYIY